MIYRGVLDIKGKYQDEYHDVSLVWKGTRMSLRQGDGVCRSCQGSLDRLRHRVNHLIYAKTSYTKCVFCDANTNNCFHLMIREDDNQVALRGLE